MGSKRCRASRTGAVPKARRQEEHGESSARMPAATPPSLSTPLGQLGRGGHTAACAF
jgi:hypothetical protein